MVSVIAGEKGQGKTKKLITMANDEVKVTDGNVVFINNDDRFIYDLHYDVRFVQTADFPLENYKMFFGFICGICSQNSDIQKIYIDGITKIVPGISVGDIEELAALLDAFSSAHHLDFIMTLSAKIPDLPEGISKYIA